MDALPAASTRSPAPVGSPFAPANGLTSRREMFCRHYVACGNAADAARQAGYAEDSARQQGHRLLDDETIKARIEELWHHAEAARTTDRDLLIDKTERLFEAAMDAKSYNAAAQALRLQVHVAGFIGPARQREEVVPGRPGPVMRAELRKTAGEREAVAEEDRDRREESGAGTDGGGERLEADSRTASPHGPGRAAPAPAPDPTPDPDPWAEAARIARQRELAGVHSKLAAVRRRQGLASRAALAARDAEAAEGADMAAVA